MKRLTVFLALLLAPPAQAADGPLAITTQCGYTQSGELLASMELVRSDGKLDRQLYPCGDAPGVVSWAPDGASYLFTDDERATVLSDLASTQQTVVADGFDAEFAPDGESYSFVRNYNMWVGTTDGAAPRKLRHERLPGRAYWSRDGSMLAFSASNEGGVKVIDSATGEDVRRVAGQAYSVAGWLPDGRLLLIRECAKECVFGLYVVDPNAGRPKRLAESPTDQIVGAAVSPDGGDVAMIVEQRMRAGYARSTVSTRSLKGGDEKVVLRSPRYKYRSRNVSDVPVAVTWKPAR